MLREARSGKVRTTCLSGSNRSNLFKTQRARAGREGAILARGLSVVGLFAGIGGIELGMHAAGHRTELLCEIDDGAVAVLKSHFPSVPIEPDVRHIKRLPRVDVVAGGFPCQDLSQAGHTAGITGRNSGLVGEVFRLLGASSRSGPTWLLLENVPFMLQLNRGRAMRYLTRELEDLGYRWAYRIVEARAFGLPQRRRRVFLLASKKEDPRTVLYADDAGVPDMPDPSGLACGFYWTEGIRGLGWAVDAVPTLKGGSTVGIPSPPAIWMPSGEIVAPEIRDAERLQGFEPDWTLPAQLTRGRKTQRWKLVGNAVSVPVLKWVGRRLTEPGEYDSRGDLEIGAGTPWPTAAWGGKGKTYQARLSTWPFRKPYAHLAGFLHFPTAPLSERATAGFYDRMQRSSLRFPEGFADAIAEHLRRMRARSVA